MGDIAIRVENLSKLYRIGAKQERYKTLRGTLVKACIAPFRKIKNPKFLACEAQGKLYWAAIRNNYDTTRLWCIWRFASRFASCYTKGDIMITNDQELQVTQERIAHLQRWLVQIRQTARPKEFEAVANNYRLEIERMQAEVLEYLLRPLPAEREDLG